MNKLLSKRLVEIEYEEDIDRLQPGSVVYVKNSPMRVLEKKEGVLFTFYYHYEFHDQDITRLTTMRGYLCRSGNRIAFAPSGRDEKSFLKPENREYQTLKNDLVALGLMA